MDINELESYNLADAVKFHDRLNPRLWDQREHLKSDVHAKLMEIARDFQEFLGVPDLEIKDITISGSNAAYNYTSQSDIDLHLVVDMPEARNSEVFRELFDAKKFQYNTEHDIRIGGYDVELYVQDAEQEHHSQGIYSLLQNRWINVPRRRRADVDDISVRSKYEDVGHRIEAAILSGDLAQMDDAWNKLRAMRKQGLEREGEFSPENLAFKMLRNNGTIDKLKQARQAVRDRELSLAEARKKKNKKKFRYGFGGYWTPGFAFGDSGGEGDGGGGGESRVYESPDGVNPSTKMFLESDIDSVLPRFFKSSLDFLKIKNPPRMIIHHDTDWSKQTGSFGQYDPDDNVLHLATSGRHVLDILRTMAHELTHCKQNELEALPPNAGETGSQWEDEANAMAGRIMRHWADKNPEMFKEVPLEESSGYIPTRAQANDPRFKMALTVDVKPGETGRQANKLALKTDAQGRPPLLMKSANLRESRMPQPSQGQGRYRDLNEPLGPETPPTMPAGTVRVDVSDVYDWYKLGQHISNMKGLGKHDFGAGPPSSIISFGDEETEHKFIKDLEATGLDVTDIDPKDPAQPAGMRKIKTDPTYNVDEDDLVESLRREFEMLESEYISEISMRPSSLRQEAAKTGAMAGMEFEMIVPNVEADEPDPEYEPDWDQDQRTRSFDDIENFFYDGDYNGRGDVRRLIESLTERYEEWKMDQLSDDWAREGEDYLRDYIENNDLFDRDEASDMARDEFANANPDIPLDSEEAQIGIRERVDELQEEFAISEFEAQGRIYNDAFSEFTEEKGEVYDESDFLRDSFPNMSDVQSEFDIQWPYYYDANEGQSGEFTVDEVADEFSEAIGRPVNASRQYHQARREPGHYVVEPDGSLSPDNSGDGGLEFVSPPLPIDELLSDLNKVKKWANQRGCYTNDSTGLHINVSVPGYSLDKLDYVKLALLMGDEYVLDLFGRSGNHYTKAATGKIRTALQKNPDLAPAMLDKMREHMSDLATKAIHSGATDKYTSINTKSGYIEFRSPGGDWLDENFDKIENTLLRFTVALSAAIDPQAYRQEYLKKLYKLLEGAQEKGGVDVVQLFSNYSAGELDKAALIRQVRQQQLARGVEKGKVTGKMWWRVRNPAHSYGEIEVVASSKEEAIEKALGPDGYPSWANTRGSIEATPVRPYQEPTQQSTDQTSIGRPSNPDGNYVILDMADETVPVYRFMAANDEDALSVQLQWSRANPGPSWRYKSDPNQRLGQPPIPGSTLDRQRQRAAAASTTTPAANQLWSLRLADGQEVHRFWNRNDRNEAGRYAANWLRDNGMGVSGEGFSIEPVSNDRQQQSQGSDPGSLIDQGIAASGRFTGEWQVVDNNGRELYRFSGVGNSQGDANRVAQQWVNAQRAQGNEIDAREVDVLPIMG